MQHTEKPNPDYVELQELLAQLPQAAWASAKEALIDILNDYTLPSSPQIEATRRPVAVIKKIRF